MMAAGIVARGRGRWQTGALRRTGKGRDAEAADRGVLLGVGPGRQVDMLEGARLVEIGEQAHGPAQVDALWDIVDRSLGIGRARRKRAVGRLVFLQRDAQPSQAVLAGRPAGRFPHRADRRGTSCRSVMPMMAMTTSNSTSVKALQGAAVGVLSDYTVAAGESHASGAFRNDHLAALPGPLVGIVRVIGLDADRAAIGLAGDFVHADRDRGAVAPADVLRGNVPGFAAVVGFGGKPCRGPLDARLGQPTRLDLPGLQFDRLPLRRRSASGPKGRSSSPRPCRSAPRPSPRLGCLSAWHVPDLAKGRATQRCNGLHGVWRRLS